MFLKYKKCKCSSTLVVIPFGFWPAEKNGFPKKNKNTNIPPPPHTQKKSRKKHTHTNKSTKTSSNTNQHTHTHMYTNIPTKTQPQQNLIFLNLIMTQPWSWIHPYGFLKPVRQPLGSDVPMHHIYLDTAWKLSWRRSIDEMEGGKELNKKWFIFIWWERFVW